MRVLDCEATVVVPPRSLPPAAWIGDASAATGKPLPLAPFPDMKAMADVLRPLERMQIGVVALGETGLVLFCNGVANAMNRTYFHMHHGRLQLAKATGSHDGLSFSADFARSSAALVADSGRSHFLLVGRGGGCCIASRVRWHEFLGESRPAPVTLLLFRETAGSEKSLWRMLMDDLSLSYAEARIAVELHRRGDLGKVAQALGLSKETVRTQLKAVFAKLGVSKQSEVVRRIQQMLSLQI
jgi:DNA-binding CsgD family transcriptional regulator